MTRRGNRGLGATAVVLLAGLAALLILPTTAPSSVQSAASASEPLLPISSESLTAANQPNIVLILTDDQPVGYESYMPITQKLFAREGISYTNTHALTSTCCPSRSTLLTGMSSPSTGVWTNWAPDGGWYAFYKNNWEDRTIARALDRRGYRTALIGKYLNGYDFFEERTAVAGNSTYIPPGWDYWFVPASPNSTRNGRYINYNVLYRPTQDAAPQYLPFGNGPANYATDVFGRKALEVINSTPASQPLFLMLTPPAPHTPYTPPAGVSVKTTPPLPASYDQKVGKPPWISQRKSATPKAVTSVMRSQIRTLKSVDRWVGRISQTLKQTGRWDNTIFMFASDNGYFLGQYGLLAMKNHPHPASTHIPFHLVAPSLADKAGTQDGRLVTLADLTATIAEATGLDTSGLDGLPLTRPETEWRTGALVTGWRNRGLDVAGNQPSYCAWRSNDWLFIQYAADEAGSGYRELYDLNADPEAVYNLAGQPQVAQTEAGLEQQTRAACTPMPPDFTWPSTVVVPGG